MSQIRLQQILNFNADVIGATLTGYTSGAGTLSSSDTVLQAIQKLNGNIAGAGAVTSVFGRTGVVVAAANDYTFAQLASKPTTLSGYSIAATDVTAQVLTGYTSGAGTVSGTDSILAAIQKLNGNDALAVPLAGGTMTGLLTLSGVPTSALHAATKSYVDNLITGIVWTEAATSTTTNITLSGEQTLDGILTSASTVLVMGQTTQTQNGLYVSSSGSWTRSADATTGAQIAQLAVIVKGGTARANTQWVNSNASVTVGTTNITFVQMSGFGTYTNGTGITLTGNVFALDTTYTASLYVSLSGSYSNPSWITALAWSKITSTPTTVSGYGITDVTSQALTGYTSGAGTVASTDSILAAIQKLNGNDGLKAPVASPTFTGTVVIPTPFTLGAVSVTSTGTQLNYLNAATGTTGTASTNVVFSASPTFTGTPTLPTGTIGVTQTAGNNSTALATTAYVDTSYTTKANYIVREVPSGTINGSNVTFTLANTPQSGKEMIYLNGLLQTITTDYTISTNTITFGTAPFSGDTLVATYVK